MKVLLINIDSKIPNLALHKIAKYYSARGDEIIWNNPLMGIIVDKIYVSCIFTKNKRKCSEWENKAEIGGSGYSLEKKLPPEIESVKPRINLGFTTRGCIRKCSFCIVPKKEPIFERVATIEDLWNGRAYFINSKGKKEKTIITLLDNNALVDFDWFKKNCELIRKLKLRVDFNQGLDHRLLNSEIVNILKKTPHIEYRFAFDHPAYLPTVEKAIKLLKAGGINRCNWYVLVGFNTTFQEDLARLHFLKKNNQNAYVQRYEESYSKPEYMQLARWANQHHIFQAMTFEQFLDLPKNRKMRIRTEHYDSR